MQTDHDKDESTPVVPYASFQIENENPISVFSAFAGVIVSCLMAIVAVLFAVHVIGAGRRVIRGHATDAFLGFSILVLYILMMLWMARWYQKRRDPGCAIGIFIGTGMSLLIAGVVFFINL